MSTRVELYPPSCQSPSPKTTTCGMSAAWSVRQTTTVARDQGQIAVHTPTDRLRDRTYLTSIERQANDTPTGISNNNRDRRRVERCTMKRVGQVGLPIKRHDHHSHCLRAIEILVHRLNEGCLKDVRYAHHERVYRERDTQFRVEPSRNPDSCNYAGDALPRDT